MQLPNDPVMLMSFCNARLRDEYESLDELCSSLDVDKGELCARLAEADYHYHSDRHQFL